MKHIDEELDYMILTGSVISTIYRMDEIPDNDWDIGLESIKYGDGLAK